MAKIDFSTGKPLPTLSSKELDRLLNSDISATKISATKDIEFSATKPTTDISATKVSDTKYMNNYKREHYDTIRIDLPKGSKELLKQEAMKRNISVTKLIKQAVLMYINEK